MLVYTKNGVHNETPTVEELIGMLKDYNPKAKVRIHFTAWMDENNITETTTDGREYFIGNLDCDGTTGHPFVGSSDFNDSEVWIYSKGLI